MDKKLKTYFISIGYRKNNLEKSLVKSSELAIWPHGIWLEFHYILGNLDLWARPDIIGFAGKDGELFCK